MPGVERLLGDPVRPGYGCDAPAQGGQRIAPAGIGQIGAYDLRRGRHRLQPPLAGTTP